MQSAASTERYRALPREQEAAVADEARPVAYVMSRFPKLTETFVLFEALEMERQGTPVEIYPLLRERCEVMHPEAQSMVERAHYTPLLSSAIVAAVLRNLFRRPARLMSALATTIRANIGSPKFLTGGLLFFPKTVYLAEQMERRGVGHLHAHFASHPAAAAYVIHRLTGIPYSFVAHGTDLHVDRHMLREKVRDAAFVVAISDYNRELILSECGREHAEKVIVVHCGVDPSVFRPREHPCDAGGPLRRLCTGTLHEVKGQRYLIEACALLRDRGVKVECRFIGEGADRAALTELIRQLGLETSVQLLGSLPREAVARELAAADVLVAPSVPTKDGRREGIPVALMEGMATGIPVVASDLSGIPELVVNGESGLLTEPRNPRTIADALERLAGNCSLRATLGAAGRAKVLREFNLAANVQALGRQMGVVQPLRSKSAEPINTE